MIYSFMYFAPILFWHIYCISDGMERAVTVSKEKNMKWESKMDYYFSLQMAITVSMIMFYLATVCIYTGREHVPGEWHIKEPLLFLFYALGTFPFAHDATYRGHLRRIKDSSPGIKSTGIDRTERYRLRKIDSLIMFYVSQLLLFL